MNEDRKRIRCMPCNLVQFVNKTHTCVRCKQPFAGHDITPKTLNDGAVESREPKETESLSGRSQDGLSAAPVKLMDLEFWLAFVFWNVRRKAHLTQHQAARKAGRVRTYISKLEGAGSSVLPQAKSFEHYCAALEVQPAYVLRMTEFLMWGK